MKVYADHAATTQLDIDAFEAMKPFLLNEFGNASQPYSFARSARLALKQARELIANCINAEPDEIYFTSGGTESDNWAIKAMSFAGGIGSTIITSQIEHHAILNACHSMERSGYPVIYLPVNSLGIVEPKYLADHIGDDVTLVSIMYANNEIGSIQPIKELCAIAHSKGAIFHTDAVQAVGHIPIDVKELGVDMLSASAHKFNGPKGVGFLYIKKGIKSRSFMDGGAQEYGLRAGTENIASIVAMATALDKNCKRMNSAKEHLLGLEKVIIDLLKSRNIDFVRNGDNNHIPGNINLSFKDADGEMLLHRLDLMGISVSTGSACDSVNKQISHVLKAIRVADKYAKGTIRISLGYENTKEEAEYISNSIVRILK